MSLSNYERVGRGLKILRKGLIPYVIRELKAAFKNDWWRRGVEPALTGAIGLEAQNAATDDEKLMALDIQALFAIMWENWNMVFQSKLGHVGRSYISELREVRNRWAHQQAFSVDDTYRALDTMMRLLEMISAPEADNIRAGVREMMRQRFEEETKKELKRGAEAATETQTSSGLKPWREIATPHEDVAKGRYQQAEFAADLAQIISDDIQDAEKEYKDPKEFFRRTYITEGLSQLLVLAVKRLNGLGGDPVVELQTNFGGGKTHSMIALYHLAGGQLKPADIQGIETVFQQAGIAQLPTANRAVLVGTKLNPAIGQAKKEGLTVHTFWGEMAYQLGGADGYAMVAENDRTGASPGSDTLTALFERFGPALVLIDEWVAYARQLYHVDNLPAGSFEANMTFAQALTEAAKRSPKTLVVASIPASDIEIGGEGGRAALERIRNTFGRLEAVWKPATAEESFAIVRRRLFEPITDFTARDAVCRAFAELYRQNKGDFPRDCSEGDYERRLRDAYPIHPELFDRLYQDWSTLERFQRTRGVLRLMAAVIHNLWEREDRSLLIMPGTLPIDSPAVRSEIAKYLPDGWSAVIDTDVDGPNSRPIAVDRENPNYGRYSACRRVTRTIFIGSAPSGVSQRARGQEEVRIKLGCVQPGEIPATFGDALRRMSEQLTYLYSDGNRYWFDTRPSVNRIAADRAEQFRDHVEQEILDRFKDINIPGNRGDFAAVYVASRPQQEIPDDQAARLVILGPNFPYANKGSSNTNTIDKICKILNERGNSPRLYRNTLVFVAPDRDRLVELQHAIMQLLAWRSISSEEDALNLDTFQRKQVELGVKRSEDTVKARIGETFIWLLVPTQDNPEKPDITWPATRLDSSNDPIPIKACKRLKNEEQLITLWSPAILKMELDKLLWKNQPHLGIRKLWEYLCSYIYLPRLANEKVLLDCIKEGLNSKDYFGYADQVDDQGKYLGLTFGTARNYITMDNQSVLVKPEIAQKQLDAEKKVEVEPVATTSSGTDYVPAEEGQGSISNSKPDGDSKPEIPKGKKLKRFYGNVVIDSQRVGRDAGAIAEAVIQHLTLEPGAEVTVTIEVQARIPEGANEGTVRTVTENCRALKFKDYGFEEE
ncbi:MAG: DUF499 domain-containing protein [Firmicutes bacterium]|nr:DUF499 domain-containing protein [Bacillota bacterium]